MRRAEWTSGALAALLLAGCLPEAPGRPGLSAYNVDSTGVALHGYSPVSYVEAGEPRMGSASIARKWRGITYHFTDEAQAATFGADPARFEPAFGGWCAYGMSHGIRWDPDPTAFEIVDGRLLLFSRAPDADARKLWDREENTADLLARAEHYWETLREE